MLEILRHSLIRGPHDLNTLLLLGVLLFDEPKLAVQILNLIFQYLNIVLGSSVCVFNFSPNRLLLRSFHVHLESLLLELLNGDFESCVLVLEELLIFSMVVD